MPSGKRPITSLMNGCEYLNLTPARPTWAYVADAILGRAVAYDSKNVENGAKVNVFLQTWKVSLRQAGGLPEDLRRMVKTAEKYGIRVDTPNPAKMLQHAMPIWYHLGKTEGRSTANSKAAKCLRTNHGVSTVLQATKVAGRLPRQGAHTGTHRPNQHCACVSCDEDRRIRGCDNPHRCAMAAAKLLEHLVPVWNVSGPTQKDGLTLTERRIRSNVESRADEGRVIFNPSITDNSDLADVFRIFVNKEALPRDVPARRAPRPYQVAEEAVEVHTDGSCDSNGAGTAVAGSGVFFGPSDSRNLALRVPGELQSNQIAEIYAVSAAVAAVPPFAPLHIVSDSNGSTASAVRADDHEMGEGARW
ncbi:hypothetical protein C8T65DRAFT_781194 [Cerioporus squamosus]|nr:hypothetical protein C8T65DRAFT_781194 [Cerioporus squamosus]